MRRWIGIGAIVVLVSIPVGVLAQTSGGDSAGTNCQRFAWLEEPVSTSSSTWQDITWLLGHRDDACWGHRGLVAGFRRLRILSLGRHRPQGKRTSPSTRP